MSRTTIALGLLAMVSISSVPAAADDLWLHVRVEDRDATRPASVKVNLPVALVAEILPHLSAERMQGGRIRLDVDRPGSTFDGADFRAILAAVKKSKDGEFVTVEEGDETVRVAKSGDTLLVKVEGSGRDGSRVDLKLPLRGADALFSEDGKSLDLVAALRWIAEGSTGEIVTVRDGDESVRIWIDANPSAR